MMRRATRALFTYFSEHQNLTARLLVSCGFFVAAARRVALLIDNRVALSTSITSIARRVGIGITLTSRPVLVEGQSMPTMAPIAPGS